MRFHWSESSRLLRKGGKVDCRDKQHYQTHWEAQKALDEYLEDILFSNMVIYPCRIHGGFHRGHDWFMSNTEVVHRENNLSILRVESLSQN